MTRQTTNYFFKITNSQTEFDQKCTSILCDKKEIRDYTFPKQSKGGTVNGEAEEDTHIVCVDS